MAYLLACEICGGTAEIELSNGERLCAYHAGMRLTRYQHEALIDLRHSLGDLYEDIVDRAALALLPYCRALAWVEKARKDLVAVTESISDSLKEEDEEDHPMPTFYLEAGGLLSYSYHHGDGYIRELEDDEDIAMAVDRKDRFPLEWQVGKVLHSLDQEFLPCRGTFVKMGTAQKVKASTVYVEETDSE